MNQEFPLGSGTRILYYLFGAVLAAFAIFFFTMPRSAGVSAAVYLIPLLFLLGAVLIFINIAKRRVIIANDTIIRINVFGTREMAFDQIKGCRIGQKAIILEPVDTRYKRMTITDYSSYADDEVLVNYLRERFTDLDAADLQASENELAGDTRYGFTTDDRKAALKKATIAANIYNGVGGIGGFALIFLRGNNFAVICEVLFPLAGIVLMAFSHGLIKFISNRKRSVYPFILIGFMLPVMGLLVGSMANYYILAYNKLLLPAIGIAVVMLVLLYHFGLNRQAGQPAGQVVLMLMLTLLFGFGLIRTLNCQYDLSPSVDITTTVAEKFTTSGKGSHYHIRLNPWHEGQALKEIDISYDEYGRIQPGDPVTIHEKPGYLHARWFYVDL